MRAAPRLRLCFLLCFAVPALSEVQRLALFVGVDEGLPEERALKYASRDAMQIAEVVRQSGTFDKDRIYLLTNPELAKFESTLKEIGGRLKELRKAGVQTMVLLYYSGHGSAEGLHVRGKQFPREAIQEMISSLESDLKIVILDACESGDFLRRKGASYLEDRAITKQDQLKSQGTIFISSSSRGEYAHESEEYKGAIFSHHLVNGLRGLADYNADGQVSLLESFDYARASTRMEEALGRMGRQSPAYDFDLVGESDPVLTRLERRRTRILMIGMPQVPLEVFSRQNQELEFRIWLTGKDSVYFQLPAGKYVLRYPRKGGYEVNSVDLTWSTEATVRQEDFRAKPKSNLYRKGPEFVAYERHGLQLGLTAMSPFSGSALAGCDYVFRSPRAKQHLGFSFGRDFLSSDTARIDTRMDIYRFAYGAKVPLVSTMHGQVLAGAEAAFHQVRQEIHDSRFGDSGISVDGIPMRTRWQADSRVLEAGLPVEAEVYFPQRIWLSFSARSSWYWYRDRAAGARTRFRVEPGVSLGHQF